VFVVPAVVFYLIVTLVLLWLSGNLLTFCLQDYFIFRPKKLHSSHTYQFEKEAVEIFIETTDGGRLNALWFKRNAAKGVVLFFHGNAGSLARWGHLHHYFERLGYDYFVYDYRGYGKSTGKRNEFLMYEDALAVFEYVKQLYNEDKIVLFGRSLGSAFASRVAVESKVKMLILETPFYSMRHLFYCYYPFLPQLFFFKYNFYNHHYLQQTDCPVYIFQGTNDWIVPYRCAIRLKKWLKPQDEFITVPGGSHNNLLFYDIYNRKMQELLK